MSGRPKAWHEKLNPLDLVYCNFPNEGGLDPAPKLGTLDLNLDKSVQRRFLAAAEAAGLLDASNPSSDDRAISS